MTKEDWLMKASWEGGVLEGLRYGLKASDLNEDVDEEFKKKIVELETLFKKMDPILSEIEVEMPMM